MAELDRAPLCATITEENDDVRNHGHYRQVGGEARTGFARRRPGSPRHRAATREKGEEWAALGCEIALADMEGAPALTAAFAGATAVFILPPPVFDPGARISRGAGGDRQRRRGTESD